MKQQFWNVFECGCRLPSNKAKRLSDGLVCPEHREYATRREVMCPVCEKWVVVSKNRNKLAACDECKMGVNKTPWVWYIFECGCVINKCARGTNNCPVCPEHFERMAGKEGHCECGTVEIIPQNHNNWKRCRSCQAEIGLVRSKVANAKYPRPVSHHQDEEDPEPVEPIRLIHNPFDWRSISVSYLIGGLESDAVVYSAMPSPV